MKNLIFEECVVRNFKCHEHFSFDYSTNRFVTIVGENGAGKTSGTIDSICYALYDITTKNNKSDSVITKRTGKNLEIILKLRIDDDRYEIRNYRKHDKHGDAKFLFKNDKDISEITRKLTNEKIQQIILPYSVFINCILFSQYINSSFIELNNSDKQGILDTMLMLDYSSQYEKASEKLKELEASLRNYETRLPVLISKIEQNREFINKEVKLYKTSKREAEDGILKTHLEIEEINLELKIRDDTLEKINVLQIQYNDIKSDIKSLNDKLENQRQKCREEIEKETLQQDQLRDKEISKATLSILKEKEQIIETISSLEKDKSNHIRKMDAEINTINQKISTHLLNYNNNKNILENNNNASIRAFDETITSLSNQISEKQTLIEKYKKDIISYTKNLQKKIPKCPKCEQDLLSGRSNIESELNDMKAKVIELTAEIKDQETSLSVAKKDKIEFQKKANDSLIKKKQEYDTEKKELDSDKQDTEKTYKNKISALESSIRTESSKITKLEQQIETEKRSITKKYEECIKQSKDAIINKHKEHSSQWISSKDEYSVKLSDLENEIRDMETVKTKLDNFSKSLDIKTNNLSHLKKQIDKSFIEIKAKYKDSYSKIRDYKEEVEKLRSSVKITNEEIEMVKFWKQAFSDSGIKSIIIDEAIPILNSRAIELSNLTENIKVRFDSQITLKSGEQRNKFAIKALNSKHLSEFEEFSAGETKIVNIIVLLCLRHLLEKMHDRNINLLLLDEILDSLSEKNASIVIDMIRKLSEDHCVLLVSHTLRDYIVADENLSF